MAQANMELPPVLTTWSYHSLAPSIWYSQNLVLNELQIETMHFHKQQIHIVVEKSQHHACESLGNLKRNTHKKLDGWCASDTHSCPYATTIIVSSADVQYHLKKSEKVQVWSWQDWLIPYFKVE